MADRRRSSSTGHRCYRRHRCDHLRARAFDDCCGDWRRTPLTVAPAQQYSADEQAAAKQHLCSVFDASTKGQEGQGGLRIDGDPNAPLLLRKLTGIVAVESAMTKAPNEIAGVARNYIDANLDQMNAALGAASVDDINTLTTSANEATYALADACGLPH